MTKKILIILVLISLNSCYDSMPKSWEWGARPRPFSGVRGFPETDTDYGKGFKEGCSSAWLASGKGWTDIIQNKINPALMSRNPDWGSGWWDGYEQCTYIIDWDVV